MSDDEFNVEALTKHKTQKEAQARAAAIQAAQGDPELEAILLETQAVKKETLSSTQRSVKMINETVAVADRTNEKLSVQGEQLNRIADTADRADQNANQSYQSAKDLHTYKGMTPWSIKNLFKGKDKKQQDRALEEARKERTTEPSRAAADGRSPPSSASAGPKGPQYADETEQEINQNLDQISAGLNHLQKSGLAMQQQMAQQDKTIKYINATTDHTNYTINSAGRKISEFE